MNILVRWMFWFFILVWLIIILSCGVLILKLVIKFLSWLDLVVFIISIWVCLVRVFSLVLLWFLICILKLLMVFSFGIGGGGKILRKLLGMLVNLVCRCLVMVSVLRLVEVCDLNGLSMKNMIVVFGMLMKLFIDRFGKVMMFFIFGLLRLIWDICLIIVLVCFSDVLFGNWVMLIR